MKKTIFLGLLLTIAMFGCQSSAEKKDVFKSNNEIYFIQSMTAVNVLDEMSFNTKSAKANVIEKSSYEEMAEKIDDYLTMFDDILLKKDNLNIKEEVSDKDGYTIKMIFTSINLSLETKEYTLYLNEKIKNEQDDDLEYDDEKPYDEVETLLSGIIILDDNEYLIEGKKEVEEEGELEIELKIMIDEENYVIIEQEKEEDEIEYEYSVYQKKRLFKQFSFEYEIDEDNELEIELNILENNQKNSYKFKKIEENDITYIKVQHKQDNQNIVIFVKSYIDSTTGEIIYEYKFTESNNSIKIKK